MTLIIGVKCQDGIVTGSDSLETFPTEIEQEVSNKIENLADDALIASAGAVGLSQLLKERLRESWHDVCEQDNIANARWEIQNIIWSEVRPALLHAADAGEILGKISFPLLYVVRCWLFPYKKIMFSYVTTQLLIPKK